MAKDRGVAPERLHEYLGPMVHRHYLAAERYDKFDIWKMMVCNNTVTREFGRLMERFDVLLVPTMAVRVPETLEPGIELLWDACRYTMPANETGLPGISV